MLRHGQTEWNAIKRHQGQKDSPLTKTGVGHAQSQARILRSAIQGAENYDFFSSPSGRAWQTAGHALTQFGHPIQPDKRLMEVSFGLWEGKTDTEIDEEFPDNRRVTDTFDWHFTAPGGERLDDVVARVTDFLNDLTRPSVIVMHGITSRVLRGVWLGLDRQGMSDIDGGQGNVFHLCDGAMRNLTE